jgi:NTP pyrophosphatase (non-canonical NTP hydrolase)
MHPNEYQRLASVTECDQTRSLARMANLTMSQTKGYTQSQLRQIRLNHGILGLMGEVGELAAALERWVYYGKSLDAGNVAEEIGDCLWYLAELCNALEVSMEQVMEANIAKLRARYPEKYTDEAASNRDLEAEKKAMTAAFARERRKLEDIYPAVPQYDPAQEALARKEGEVAARDVVAKVMREIEECTIGTEGRKTDKARPPDQPNPFGYEDADE